MLENQRPDCIQYTRLPYSGNWTSLPLTPTDMGANPGIGLSHYSISLGLFQDHLSPYLGFACYNRPGTFCSIVRSVGASRVDPWTIWWPRYVLR